MSTVVFPAAFHRPKLGSAIRAIRGKWKQDYCASLVGCSRRQWIRWEQNESRPSYQNIIAIQETFKVTLMSQDVTR